MSEFMNGFLAGCITMAALAVLVLAYGVLPVIERYKRLAARAKKQNPVSDDEYGMTPGDYWEARRRNHSCICPPPMVPPPMPPGTKRMRGSGPYPEKSA